MPPTHELDVSPARHIYNENTTLAREGARAPIAMESQGVVAKAGRRSPSRRARARFPRPARSASTSTSESERGARGRVNFIRLSIVCHDRRLTGSRTGDRSRPRQGAAGSARRLPRSVHRAILTLGSNKPLWSVVFEIIWGGGCVSLGRGGVIVNQKLAGIYFSFLYGKLKYSRGVLI